MRIFFCCRPGVGCRQQRGLPSRMRDSSSGILPGCLLRRYVRQMHRRWLLLPDYWTKDLSSTQSKRHWPESLSEIDFSVLASGRRMSIRIANGPPSGWTRRFRGQNRRASGSEIVQISFLRQALRLTRFTCSWRLQGAAIRVSINPGRMKIPDCFPLPVRAPARLCRSASFGQSRRINTSQVRMERTTCNLQSIPFLSCFP